ncbi:response regulator transcription factor [Nocardioides sp. GY 10113]|uniref:response regulator transcription factor n=1 Tax=Nocardioides sp. GY 10113 TaxID=2569761 RepID=UPI0010A79932|nr:response regulator transcription factor [Nocardioides sp. GY 10113]TIC81302.1 response regulator transcription factor [Nocardioides sp. GY 10113]
MTTRVLLADDHELIRQGLARAVEREGDMEVVGHAGSVAEALAAWRALRPDVVVTDLQLPDGSGLDVVRSVRAESERVGIVVLTMHTGDAQVFAAMEAGASAFLGKESRGAEVVSTARHSATAPRAFLSPGLTRSVLRREAVASTRLTAREREILRLVADGLGTADIARRAHLGESTVKTHLNRVYRKLGVANRTQALAAAVRLGLLLDHAAGG